MTQEVIAEFAEVLEFAAGEFRFFVVRCNSVQWRSQLLSEFAAVCSLPSQTLMVAPTETHLYDRIRLEINAQEPPEVLMVVGLENNENLEQLLDRANRERDKYVQNLTFPLVLWVSDRIHTQLLRKAADLQSITETLEFPVPLAFWRTFVNQRAIQDLDAILNQGATRFLPVLATEQETNLAAELQVAAQVLTQVDTQTKAYLQFLLARSRGYQDPTAQAAYEQSLSLWPAEVNPQYRAVVHYSFGAWWRVQTQLQRRQAGQFWRRACEQFEQCITLLRSIEPSRGKPPVVAQNPARGKHGGITPTDDAVLARFINALGDALLATQQWEQLETVAQKALELHQAYPNPFKQARSLGFLAEVALAKEDWIAAQQWAEEALQMLPEQETPAEPDFKYVQAFNRAAYRWALAKAWRGQGQAEQSLATLKDALTETRPQYELDLYVQILRDLQQGYWEQGDYVQSYRYKRRRRDVETEFGVRAFLGAGRIQPQQQEQLPGQTTQRQVALEIEVSGRLTDVEQLLERVGNTGSKVTVLYGPSGVGKSSLVTGGLMPRLWDYRVGTESERVLPIYLRTYQGWREVLAQALKAALAELGIAQEPMGGTEDALIAVLTNCVGQRLRPVLVLDQFEEFFFVHPDRPERDTFFEFLGQCLSLLPFRVMFAMRVEYIYELLSRPGLDCIDGEILSNKVRYYLNYFSLEQAQTIVQDLTQRSQLSWEPGLQNAMLMDLAQGYPLLQPIELQIVGAQMQQEGIETIAQYEQAGAKDALVQRYFTEVIRDCGPESEQVAGLVLFGLTNEQGQRPLKTAEELAGAVASIVREGQLGAVLAILVMSGLVVAVADEPTRYQLVHDYLVRPIRGWYDQGLRLKVETLEQEKRVVLLNLEEAKAAAQRADEEATTATQKVRRQLRLGTGILTASVMFAGGLSWFSLQQREAAKVAIGEMKAAQEAQQLAQERTIAAVKRETVALEQADEAQQQAEVAIQRQRAAETQEKRALKLSEVARRDTEQAKQQSLIARRDAERAEQKSLMASQDAERAEQESFAAQLQAQVAQADIVAAQIQLQAATNELSSAQALRDEAKIELVEARLGSQLERLGTNALKIYASQPFEGLLLAMRSAQAVKQNAKVQADQSQPTYLAGSPLLALHNNLTDFTGYRPLPTVLEHSGYRTISPDGQHIVATSLDGTARVWNLQGDELVILRGHKDGIATAQFSENGRYIVTASLDGTARVWNRQGDELAILSGHEDRVLKAQFSSDGERIVTASLDGTARVWNLQGNELAILSGHGDWVKTAEFSHDGEHIVTASDDTARVWNRQGDELAILSGHENGVWTAQFSEDGERIVTASDDRTARVWNRQGDELAILSGHENGVLTAQFSEDGERIVTASFDGTARVWNRQGDELTILSGHEGSINTAQFSEDGERIVTASFDGTARVWNRQGDELAILSGHENGVWTAQFSEGGERIITTSLDGTARVWSYHGSELANLLGHRDRVWTAEFSSDGEHVVTASDDSTARVWNRQGDKLATLRGHESTVNTAEFSSDGEHVVTASFDGTARVWNRQGDELATLRGHEDGVWTAKFDSAGKHVVTASEDNTARVWNHQGDELAILRGHESTVNTAKFDPAGKHIVTASEDNTARVWNHQGDELAILRGHEDRVRTAEFSFDGRHIVTASDDSTARVWNRQGDELTTLRGHEDWVLTAQFSKDNKHIITTSVDGTARLWNRQGDELATLRGHEDRVRTAKFSPDGELIVTASEDGTARVWNRQGDELATLREHENKFRTAEFSPDGKHIVTASDNGTVRVWPVYPLEQLLTEGCNWLYYYLRNNPKKNKTLKGKPLCPDIPRLIIGEQQRG